MQGAKEGPSASGRAFAAAGAAPPDRRDFVYGEIREAILSGRIRPGDRLIDLEIASALKVSRTPVREALLKLLEQGLVEEIPGRHLIVTRFHEKLIRDIFEVRTEMEGLAARLAADRISEADLAEAESIFAQMEKAATNPDRTVWATLNTQFHALVHRASGNDFLGDNLDRVLARLQVLSNSWQGRQSDRTAINREHRAILTALRARDGAAAERAAQAHIEQAVWLYLENGPEAAPENPGLPQSSP